MQNSEVSANTSRMPTSIGRYEIVCKLGVGGMADVYLAHQPGPFSASKLVVIKQMRPGVLTDEQLIHMFADESRIAVRLNHPNVVHTYEVVAEQDDYYLTLEFLDGKSLHQVLARVTRERVPLDLHVWMLTQVLAGLQYAHELTDFDGSPLGIVHRDVSPSNVFVTYGGEVKLLDFGIAKSAAAIASTRDGIIKGKLGYAAPEQCLSETVDGRTDVFAVGVMLWEAIARRKRAFSDTDAGTYQARVEGTEPTIDKICPDAAAELIAACNKALARAPAERYPSAVEFRQALEQYLRSRGFESGNDRLRAFMDEHFHQDCAEMRQRIEEHLGNTRSPASAFRVGIADPNVEVPPPTARSGTAAFVQASNVPGALPSPAWYRRPAVWAMAAATLALAAWSQRSRFPLAPTDESKSHAAIKSQILAAAPASSAPATPLPTGQVTVSLLAKPAAAAMFLDGRRISNPYRAAHGRDALQHHLTVSLTGCQSVEQELAFTGDLDRTFELTPQATPRHAKPEHDGAATSTSSAKASPAPPPSLVQPGEDLRGLSRANARTLDETDPYKR